jgi:hypothetical protein
MAITAAEAWAELAAEVLALLARVEKLEAKRNAES